MGNTLLIGSHDEQKTEVAPEWAWALSEADAANGLKASEEHAGKCTSRKKPSMAKTTSAAEAGGRDYEHGGYPLDFNSHVLIIRPAKH